LRYLGQTAGRPVLDLAIAVTTDQPLPEAIRASFTGDPRFEEACLRLRCKLALAALTAQSAEELAALVEVRNRFEQLEGEVRGQRRAPDAILQVMQEQLAGLARGRQPAPRAAQDVPDRTTPAVPAATGPGSGPGADPLGPAVGHLNPLRSSTMSAKSHHRPARERRDGRGREKRKAGRQDPVRSAGDRTAVGGQADYRQRGQQQTAPGPNHGSTGKRNRDAVASDADTARNARTQKAARQAEAIGKKLFPAFMATALGMDRFFESAGYKLFLEQMLEDCGSPTDPVEQMLIQQLALCHFRVGQLHASAGEAKSSEAAKLYNSIAARLLGEFRRTALALCAYRTRAPDGQAVQRMKIFKAAQ
jgi:hypothetical protein